MVLFYYLLTMFFLSDSAYSNFLVKVPQRHQIPLPSKGNKPWMPNASHRSRLFVFETSISCMIFWNAFCWLVEKRLVTAMFICSIYHRHFEPKTSSCAKLVPRSCFNTITWHNPKIFVAVRSQACDARVVWRKSNIELPFQGVLANEKRLAKSDVRIKLWGENYALQILN